MINEYPNMRRQINCWLIIKREVTVCESCQTCIVFSVADFAAWGSKHNSNNTTLLQLGLEWLKSSENASFGCWVQGKLSKFYSNHYYRMDFLENESSKAK